MTRRRRLGEALALAGLLLFALVLYNRGLDAPANYDEGVYLASLDALKHGQALGSEVYASQPPGFYVLLRAFGLFGFGLDGTRIEFALLALAGLGAAYAIGRRLTGIGGGLLAAGLLAVTAPYPAEAPRTEADTASVALSLAAVAIAFHAGRRPWWWALSGVATGAAIAVKLLALPVIAPLVVLLVGRRSWRAAGAFAAGAVAVWALLLGAYAGVVGDLWQSVVEDHRGARDLGPSLGDNVERILLHPLDWRTAAAALVVAGLVCAALFLRRLETLALAAWIGVSALFLVLQRPLLDHHLVLLAATLAVPAGAGLAAGVQRLPRRAARVAVVAVVIVALAAAVTQEGRRFDRLGNGQSAAVLEAANDVATSTAPDELVGTDLPIVPYLARRRVPGQLVDSSFVRLGSSALTDAQILDVLQRDRIRAVVVGRLYAERPELLRRLRERYPMRLQADGITLYLAP